MEVSGLTTLRRSSCPTVVPGWPCAGVGCWSGVSWGAVRSRASRARRASRGRPGTSGRPGARRRRQRCVPGTSPARRASDRPPGRTAHGSAPRPGAPRSEPPGMHGPACRHRPPPPRTRTPQPVDPRGRQENLRTPGTGGGCMPGRENVPERRTTGAGPDHVHTAVDHHSHPVHSKIHTNENASTRATHPRPAWARPANPPAPTGHKPTTTPNTSTAPSPTSAPTSGTAPRTTTAPKRSQRSCTATTTIDATLRPEDILRSAASTTSMSITTSRFSVADTATHHASEANAPGGRTASTVFGRPALSCQQHPHSIERMLRQILPDRSDTRPTLPDRGANPLDRSGAHVPGGEHPGH